MYRCSDSQKFKEIGGSLLSHLGQHAITFSGEEEFVTPFLCGLRSLNNIFKSHRITPRLSRLSVHYSRLGILPQYYHAVKECAI